MTLLKNLESTFKNHKNGNKLEIISNQFVLTFNNHSHWNLMNLLLQIIAQSHNAKSKSLTKTYYLLLISYLTMKHYNN